MSARSVNAQDEDGVSGVYTIAITNGDDATSVRTHASKAHAMLFAARRNHGDSIFIFLQLRPYVRAMRTRTHSIAYPDAKVMSYFILAFTNVLYSVKVALRYFSTNG